MDSTSDEGGGFRYSRFEDKQNEGLVRFQGFMGGVRDDYIRRLRHYRSDILDCYSWKTLSAALFMFFATFSSTVALGVVIEEKTDHSIGVTEYLLMNSVAGMVHALLGCQPLLVLRPTGPITAILGLIYELGDTFSVPFFHLLAWSGVFCGIYMTIVAGLELSRWIKYLTRFTHDIFAFFVCSIYIKDGFSGAINRFEWDSYETAASSLLAFLVFVLTFALALWFNGAKNWNTFTREFRSFLVDYAVTIAVLVAVCTSYMFRKDNDEGLPSSLTELMDRVDVPNSLQPTCAIPPGLNAELSYVDCSQINSTLIPRSWSVDLSDSSLEVILLGAATAFPIVFFFFMDQNVSSILTQRPAMRLAKGSYYHSSMLWMGIFNMVGPLFGLPFVTGSLPHSPQLVKALWENRAANGDAHTFNNFHKKTPDVAACEESFTSPAVPLTRDCSLGSEVLNKGLRRRLSSSVMKEPTTNADMRPKPLNVFENRVAPFLMYLLIGVPLFLPEIIRVIPTGAIDAILAFVGVAGLFECELWERIVLFLQCPSAFPQDKSYCQVKWWKMHSFTLLQILCIAIAWAVNLSPFGLLFSVIVVLLVPFRAFVIPRMGIWTAEELEKQVAWGSALIATYACFLDVAVGPRIYLFPSYATQA